MNKILITQSLRLRGPLGIGEQSGRAITWCTFALLGALWVFLPALAYGISPLLTHPRPPATGGGLVGIGASGLIAGSAAGSAGDAQSVLAGATQRVRLQGHVLPALAKATKLTPSAASPKDTEPLTLTLVLKREDQVGFERYLRDVYDRNAPLYHRFLKQPEIADRFGPSSKAYGGVLGYFRKHGFELVEGSANRMMITVRGTRAQVERTFRVHIGDYRIGDSTFFANDREPTLPSVVAARVHSVAGLADLAVPRPAVRAIRINLFKVSCFIELVFQVAFPFNGTPTGNQIRKYFKRCVNFHAAAVGYRCGGIGK
ncbi:MAG: protease pro-enzyme activation domain-containing protein [Candidatus Binatia bacterium]